MITEQKKEKNLFFWLTHHGTGVLKLSLPSSSSSCPSSPSSSFLSSYSPSLSSSTSTSSASSSPFSSSSSCFPLLLLPSPLFFSSLCSPVAQLKPGFGEIISAFMKIQPLTEDQRGGAASERGQGLSEPTLLSPIPSFILLLCTFKDGVGLFLLPPSSAVLRGGGEREGEGSARSGC